MRKVGCVILKVSDLEKSVAFYRESLGIKVDFEMDSLAMLKTSGCFFGLEKASHNEKVGSGINLTFEIENGVDELYKELESKGVKFKGRPYNTDWGGRIAVLTDPDGYEVGFYEMLGPLCEACGMPINSAKMRGGGIEDNPYCVYCCNEAGKLKSREEVREGMITGYYMAQRGMSRKESEKACDEAMKWLPAWKK